VEQKVREVQIRVGDDIVDHLTPKDKEDSKGAVKTTESIETGIKELFRLSLPMMVCYGF